MRREVFKTICAIAILTSLTAVAAFGAVTKGMVYQGRLADTNGRSLSSVNSIRFVIYDALIDGNELWGETHTSIVLDDQGVFTVELGMDTVLTPSIFSSGNVYLQLVVDGVPMNERQLFGAAPFAYTMGSHGAATNQVLRWNGSSWGPGSLAEAAGIAYEFNNALVFLTNSTQAADSIVIVAPGPGYVVVLARAFANNDHVFQQQDLLRMWIDNTIGAINHDLATYWRTNGNSPTNFGSSEGRILWCMKVEAVAAGSHKYYLNADVFVGNGRIERMHMTAMFFPTAYGDVAIRKAAGSGGLDSDFLSGPGSDGTGLPSLGSVQNNLPVQADIVGLDTDQSTTMELEQRVAQLEALLKELIQEAKK